MKQLRALKWNDIQGILLGDKSKAQSSIFSVMLFV